MEYLCAFKYRVSGLYHSVNLLLSPSLITNTDETFDASGTPIETLVRYLWRFHPSSIDGAESLIKVILAPALDMYPGVTFSMFECITLSMSTASFRFLVGTVFFLFQPSNSESPLHTLLASAADALFAKQSQLSISEVIQQLPPGRRN
ncbi:hypothetical protein N7495_009872 [Penicillium taxi]|uniref:uncharacterized protein n=1 Tax=Penicillium taxi TaxID=168475 RepID=UPI0025456731|nr:uncharacterized protein N7495_009872 [Penicillium taxi]KAJ5885362.1 hypothetical protein N7495_009872 [Penicillium taxi]